MPEGHTIHRLARDHTKLLAGRAVAVSSPQGRFTADAALVNGEVLERVEPYGKHLFYWWANGLVGHVHLGLIGKFQIYPAELFADPAPNGIIRMRMRSDLATIDLSGPMVCAIETETERDAAVAKLGPDPLRRDAKPELAFARIKKSKLAIGALLLDQAVMCGVGNVFRAEALFVLGINPTRPGRLCTDDELIALWATITSMLRKGVKENRIVTIDRREFHVPKGGRPRRGETTYVYHRDRCLRCDTPVQTVALAGRPCYFCPTCQPA